MWGSPITNVHEEHFEKWLAFGLIPLVTLSICLQEVFWVWEAFRMRMPGSSESAFIKTLEDLSLLRGRVIYFIILANVVLFQL